MKTLSLLSVYLPPDLSVAEIAETLKLPLKKGLEATHYASMENDRWLFFSRFDVITFVNWSQTEIHNALDKLGIQQPQDYKNQLLYQDYQIRINPQMTSNLEVCNDQVQLAELNDDSLMVVALVVSQSVGLEHFERTVDQYYDQGRTLLENSGRFSWLVRKKFSDFAKTISLLKHDMVLDLMLLDKPDILWDREKLEQLYNELSELLELKERFDIIGYKLNNLKDDIAMMMDLYHHKHSSFLEWIIIILIAIEIVMALLELH